MCAVITTQKITLFVYGVEFFIRVWSLPLERETRVTLVRAFSSAADRFGHCLVVLGDILSLLQFVVGRSFTGEKGTVLLKGGAGMT